MIKDVVKKVFNSLGFTVTRYKKPGTNPYNVVRVGKFDVEINARSGLEYCYKHCADYGAQLMRLTAFLSQTYKDLKVIDIGANQGDSVALIKSGADVPVISVEGDNKLFDIHSKNTAQFKNITLVKTFLSDAAAELDCNYLDSGNNLAIIPGERSAKSVLTKFTSIDELYSEKVFDVQCKLLKIDTEGFDLKIIRGSENFITAVKPVILFEYNRDNLSAVESDPFSIFSWLEKRSYNTILFYESDGRFMLSTTLSNHKLLKQLYDYVDGKNAKIYYLDIIAFHSDQDELANEFVQREEGHRLS
jgi:FkbM family methyltransferase